MEFSRQFVHLSGLLFIILAQFVGSLLASFYFLTISLFLLIYSEYVRRQEKRWSRLLHRMESRFRDMVTGLEREDVPRPFVGAFWFYFACGLAFLIYPLSIASAACAMLAVGDSLATILGKSFGRHRIFGSKTLTGSAVMFAASLLVGAIFVAPLIALVGAVAATLMELLPAARALENVRRRGFLDDNFLIPIISGAVMLAVILLL